MGTSAQKGSKTALIRMTYDYEWNDHDGHNGFEQTFIHELLHVVAVEQGVAYVKGTLKGDALTRWGEYEEDSLDRLAGIIISALDNHG